MNFVKHGWILNNLNSGDHQKQILGALMMMLSAFNGHIEAKSKGEKQTIEEIYKNILRLLREESSLSIYSAAWCIAWSGYGERSLISPEIAARMCNRLADLWVNRDMSYEMRRVVSWGIVNVCMPSFQGDILQGIAGLEEMIEKCYKNPASKNDAWAAIYLGILLELWSVEETSRKIKERKGFSFPPNKSFLQQRGFD